MPVLVMNQELNDRYQNLAVDALYRGLVGFKMVDQQGDMHISSAELLEAFQVSGDILRSNRERDCILVSAESVFTNCIYLARCLYFPAEARVLVLNGDEHLLDAEGQVENLRRNMGHLHELLDNR